MASLTGAFGGAGVIVAAVAFWLAAGAAAWVFAGYPLALRALPRRRWQTDDVARRVSVIIPCYREVDELPLKLASLRELDFPRESLEVIVVSDGEPALVPVATAGYPGATVLLQPERRGKTAALNRGLAEATGDVVVLTDADNPVAPGSVKAVVTHFADPDVAAVVGPVPGNGSAYESYEHLLRRLESRSGSVSAASGGFIAARRALLPSFPEGIVNEDTWLVCRLARAGRIVYEPAAASSEPATSVAGEIERRARMGAGRTLLVGEIRGLPRGFAWRLVSHKVGRLALPFLLALALISSMVLATASGGWRIVAGVQLAGYGLGVATAAGLRLPGFAGKIARAARQFVVGNWAIGLGVVRALRSRQPATWRHVA